MQIGRVIEVNTSISLLAAKISLQHKLPMADSLIFTTAKTHNAILWTQDSDFENLPDVNYILK